ncbi:cutinase family protein [Kitasatospora sp. Ki12]
MAYSVLVNQSDPVKLFTRTDCGRTVKPITSPLNQAIDPAISPNGQQLAVSETGPNSNRVITVIDLASGTPLRLDTGPDDARQPAWSPDGSKLAFVANDYVGKTSSIKVVSPAGGPVTSLSDGTADKPVRQPAWAPTGDIVTYAVGQPDGPARLESVSVTGGSQSTLFDAGIDGAFGPSYSPDGQYLIFSRHHGGSWQIWSRTLATGALNQLTLATYDVLRAALGTDWTLYYSVGAGREEPAPSKLQKQFGLHALNLNSNVETILAADNIQGFGTARGGHTTNLAPDAFTRCPSLELVGARGSRANAQDTNDWDQIIGPMKASLEKAVPGLRSYPIHYAAIPLEILNPVYSPAYVTSIEGGQSQLAKYLDDFTTACPSTYIAIIAWSQGAHVATNTIPVLSIKIRSHIAAMVLLGDPKFIPSLSPIDRGDYDPALKGVFAGILAAPKLVPDDMTSRVRDYCSQGDPICNFSIDNALHCGPSCPHFLYADRGWTDGAADWIIGQWRGSAPLD